MSHVANCGSNLCLIELTVPLNTLVGIAPTGVQTSIALDVGKSVIWPTSMTTLEMEI